MAKRRTNADEFKALGKGLMFLVKSPYKLAKKLKSVEEKVEKKVAEKEIRKKREKIFANYVPFEIIETEAGDYRKWVEKVWLSDSSIGIILGSRGSGKSAFGIKFLENFYSKHKKKCYSIGFKKEEMPSWIEVVEDIKNLGNDAFVLIDEGGILFSSRSSMSSANKLLSELILVARHKNLSILFISQNSSNLDVNILRQADFLILKPSSLLQKEFERKIIKNIYDSSSEGFLKYKDKIGLSYVYSDSFRGFVSNPLPSFWKESLSKGFR